MQKFLKNPKIHAIIALYFLCDILPRLPDPVAKKIADKVMNMLGLGE